MELLAEYGLFVAKSLTLVVLIVLAIVAVFAAGRGNKGPEDGRLEVRHLNDWLEDMQQAIKGHVLSKAELKAEAKARKKEDKAKAKAAKHGEDSEVEKRVYVLDFNGDIKASAVEHLREEITALLTLARPGVDEVMLRLESPGGVVHGYGLAASQLERIRAASLKLTICVDKVAASGGYMMACIADELVAAPFAVLGSIGVVAQVPNIHRLLKKNDVDVDVLTAGEYKRTLTVLGENTDKAREKFKQDLEQTHELFKGLVSSYRPQLDMAKAATGEIWYGKQAVETGMVDSLMTSDQWVMQACKASEVYSLRYTVRKGLQAKIGGMFAAVWEQGFDKLGQWLESSRFHR